MTKTTLKVEGMMCEGCVSKVQSALESLNGVDSVEVNLKKGTATVIHQGLSDYLNTSKSFLLCILYMYLYINVRTYSYIF